MAYQGQQNADIRATLAVSQAEAFAGTQRKLNLPDGRQVVVNIAAGTHDGQEIRLEGEGQPSGYGNERGALILTIAIVGGEQSAPQTFPQQDSDSPTQFIQPPPPPLVVPDRYPAAEAQNRNIHYSRPDQQAFYANQTQQ